MKIMPSGEFQSENNRGQHRRVNTMNGFATLNPKLKNRKNPTPMPNENY